MNKPCHCWKRCILTVLVIAAMLSMQPLVTLAADIRGDRTLTQPIVTALLQEFAQDHAKEADELKFIAGDEWTNGQSFGQGRCDLLISIGPLSAYAGMTTIIAQASPDGNFIQWEKADVGQLRVVVLVNAANTIQQLSFNQLQLLLSQDWGRKTTWQDLGGNDGNNGNGGLVTCYGEHLESASREIVRSRVMTFERRPEPGVKGMWSSGTEDFRENLGLCFDASELIEAIAKDANGIGLVCYAGPLPKEVRPVAIVTDKSFPKENAEKDTSKELQHAIMPRMDTALQKDYPLSQPVILHLHPQAGQAARVFFSWARQKFHDTVKILE